MFLLLDIGDVNIINVTSDNFELYWTIPSQCTSSAEIEMEVNGTVFSIKYDRISRKISLPSLLIHGNSVSIDRPSSVKATGSNIACGADECRISRKIMPSDMLLAPCSDYSVRVETNNLTFTTFPGMAEPMFSIRISYSCPIKRYLVGDSELEISPNKTSVTAVVGNNHNHLDIEMAFDTFDGRCSARLIAIELQLPDVHPPVQHVLLCEAGSKVHEQNSTALICSGRVQVHRMDRCKAIPITFRPLYEDILFAQRVRWASMEIDPLSSKLQRNEKKVTKPGVNVVNGDKRQNALVNWDEPLCLLADSLSWEIRINSTADDIHRIPVPTGCSTAIGSSSFQHVVNLENGYLLGCNDSNNTFDYPESNFILFSPCSSYLVSVIPVQRNSNATLLEEYAQSMLLNVPFGNAMFL